MSMTSLFHTMILNLWACLLMRRKFKSSETFALRLTHHMWRYRGGPWVWVWPLCWIKVQSLLADKHPSLCFSSLISSRLLYSELFSSQPPPSLCSQSNKRSNRQEGRAWPNCQRTRVTKFWNTQAEQFPKPCTCNSRENLRFPIGWLWPDISLRNGWYKKDSHTGFSAPCSLSWWPLVML